MRRAGRRSRGPGAVNGIVVVGLVLILTMVALTTQQQPPPTVAEFAPQAIDRIEDAPEEQTSEFGAAEGGIGGGAQPTPTLPVVREVIDVPRVRRCVGDPPRQTEDPQSPPCVPYWEGDNGGATSRGVTGSEIHLIQAGGATEETARVYSTYFNRRFEFYGRKLTIHTVEGLENTCEEQKALVADIVEQYRAFAVIDSANAEAFCFHRELARRGVVSVHTNVVFTEAELAALHPYMWQYVMGFDPLIAAQGEMVCARLAGRNAVHSSDSVYQRTPRKFGVILHEQQREGVLDLGPLYRELERCGVKDPLTLRSQQAEGAEETTFSSNAILRMKTEGVTSVICLCSIFKETNLSIAATQQNYHPEWLLSSYVTNDYSVLVKLFWTSDHRQNIIGISAIPPMRAGQHEPAYYAAKEADPGVDPGALGQALNAYRTLLLLSSGIQMAGPNLTPDAFADALHKTRFPNPPSRSGTVGFEGRKHTMTNDLSEFWWSESTRDPTPWFEQGPGTLCYVDRGARRLPGSWPTGPDTFYRPPCVADPGP